MDRWQHVVRDQIRRVVHELDGSPGLIDVRVESALYQHSVLVSLEFDDGQKYHFRIDERAFQDSCHFHVTNELNPNAFVNFIRDVYYEASQDRVVNDRVRDMWREYRLRLDAGETYEQLLSFEIEIRRAENHARRNHAADAFSYTFQAERGTTRRRSPRSYRVTDYETRIEFGNEPAPTLDRSMLRDAMARVYEQMARGNIGFDWGGEFVDSTIDPEAARRAEELLVEHLSEDQRKQYETNKYFDVKGSKTGKTYRIQKGTQMNVLAMKWQKTADVNVLVRDFGLCFLPQGNLPAGDVMLAQKITLENDEERALEKGNRF